MTIGQGLSFPDQPDRGRIATYRVGIGPDLWGNAISATFVGARGAIWALRVHIVKSWHPTVVGEGIMAITKLGLALALAGVLSLGAAFSLDPQAAEYKTKADVKSLYKGALLTPA